MRLSPPVIEPLGVGGLTPAILVSYPSPAASAHSTPDSSRVTVPPWFVHVDQQAGGMVMSYPEASGALLRLAANMKHAVQDPTPLIEGFRCMAEEPDYRRLERDHPQLRRLCGTWGRPYSRDELRTLDSVLRRYFNLPSPVDGIEAFVRLEPCDPLNYVDGWRMVEVPDHVDSIEAGSGEDCWFDGRTMNEGIIDDLLEIANHSKGVETLTMYLLWENSD